MKNVRPMYPPDDSDLDPTCQIGYLNHPVFTFVTILAKSYSEAGGFGNSTAS